MGTGAVGDKGKGERMGEAPLRPLDQGLDYASEPGLPPD